MVFKVSGSRQSQTLCLRKFLAELNQTRERFHFLFCPLLLTFLAEHYGAVIERLFKIRLELNCDPQFLESLLLAAHRTQNERKTVMRLGIFRQKPHRRRRFGKSFVLMAEPSQDDPEALVRLSEFAARANGLAKFAGRRLRLARLFDNEPQIVMGLFILWSQLRRVRQFRSGASEILILD